VTGRIGCSSQGVGKGRSSIWPVSECLIVRRWPWTGPSRVEPSASGPCTIWPLRARLSFIERQSAQGLPAPETLRRLRRAMVGDGHVRLRDDATALLVEWRTHSERTLLPRGSAGYGGGGTVSR
jgi:hypothetical protein